MSTSRQFMAILWPAFLLACALEFVVFSMVDPSELHWGGDVLRLSRQSVYSLSFFIFWGMAAAAGAFTALLVVPPPRAIPEPDL